MESDARVVRGGKPFVFTNCLTGEGIADLLSLLRRDILFDLPPSRMPA